MKTVALVGYGYWGPNLLRNYMELPGARVKWVRDSKPEALAKATSRYPTVEGTTDYEEVLADPQVDAVLLATPISTPSGWRRPPSRRASTYSSRSP